MQPVSSIKMSKRDIARGKFIQQHRRNLDIRKSLSNQFTVESEKIKDV